MYNNILLPIAMDHGETTEQALKAARHLVSPDGKITAIHVMEAMPTYILTELPAGIIEQGKKEAHDELVAVVGSDIRPLVLTGHAGVTIVEFADANDIDCIIVASHKPGIQDYFLGSTAARVVRHAHCTVHVVR